MQNKNPIPAQPKNPKKNIGLKGRSHKKIPQANQIGLFQRKYLVYQDIRYIKNLLIPDLI